MLTESCSFGQVQWFHSRAFQQKQLTLREAPVLCPADLPQREEKPGRGAQRTGQKASAQVEELRLVERKVEQQASGSLDSALSERAWELQNGRPRDMLAVGGKPYVQLVLVDLQLGVRPPGDER